MFLSYNLITFAILIDSGGITQHDKGLTNMATTRHKAKTSQKNRKCYRKWFNTLFTGKGKRTSQIKAEPTPESVSFDLTN